ncbi:hypothetical protein HF521_012695 [Silurus meridionalis]|uniref:Uncharacterized protein n=1 Tax=Silurus meridionalis TaxID=175797 RepID=A0A8T0AE15_SILME|nr:hypothetical protein HF521_012695 [Silurus meridionalis]
MDDRFSFLRERNVPESTINKMIYYKWKFTMLLVRVFGTRRTERKRVWTLKRTLDAGLFPPRRSCTRKPAQYLSKEIDDLWSRRAEGLMGDGESENTSHRNSGVAGPREVGEGRRLVSPGARLYATDPSQESRAATDPSRKSQAATDSSRARLYATVSPRARLYATVPPRESRGATDPSRESRAPQTRHERAGPPQTRHERAGPPQTRHERGPPQSRHERRAATESSRERRAATESSRERRAATDSSREH